MCIDFCELCFDIFFKVFVGLGLPRVSWGPKLCEFKAVVLVRIPNFGEMRVSGRFVVLVGGISVYYMLMCMFWIVSGLVLPLEWSPGLCRVFVDCVL